MRDPQKPSPTDYIWKYTILPFIPRSVTPNQVTILRMALTPFAITLIAIGEYRYAIPFFIFLALTDALDGAMARLRKQITAWGTLWDPMADKLLVGAAVVVIVFEHVNFYLGIILLFLELVAVVGGYLRFRHGQIHPANIWGKIKMVLEVAGVVSLLVALAFDVDLLVNLSFGTLALAVVFAVMSLVTQSH